MVIAVAPEVLKAQITFNQCNAEHFHQNAYIEKTLSHLRDPSPTCS